MGYFPGSGGDIWAVEHIDGTIGAYMFNEVTDSERRRVITEKTGDTKFR